MTECTDLRGYSATGANQGRVSETQWTDHTIQLPHGDCGWILPLSQPTSSTTHADTQSNRVTDNGLVHLGHPLID